MEAETRRMETKKQRREEEGAEKRTDEGRGWRHDGGRERQTRVEGEGRGGSMREEEGRGWRASGTGRGWRRWHYDRGGFEERRGVGRCERWLVRQRESSRGKDGRGRLHEKKVFFGTKWQGATRRGTGSFRSSG